MPPFNTKNTLFFAFCFVEEIYLVVHGDDANLRLIIFYVVNCYYFVMSNWMALIFIAAFRDISRLNVDKWS